MQNLVCSKQGNEQNIKIRFLLIVCDFLPCVTALYMSQIFLSFKLLLFKESYWFEQNYYDLKYHLYLSWLGQKTHYWSQIILNLLTPATNISFLWSD